MRGREPEEKIIISRHPINFSFAVLLRNAVMIMIYDAHIVITKRREKIIIYSSVMSKQDFYFIFHARWRRKKKKSKSYNQYPRPIQKIALYWTRVTHIFNATF